MKNRAHVQCLIINDIKAFIKKYFSRNFPDKNLAVFHPLMSKPCNYLFAQNQQEKH